MQQQEEFKPVKGFGTRYEVSNLGRIISHSSKKKGGELVQVLNVVNGYMYVTLKIGGLQKSLAVHRLVADAFIPNPDNLPCINHINEDKTDNRAENLEWCEYKYNINYGSRTDKASATQ